jgi:mono/diheme cytochrome c family protein
MLKPTAAFVASFFLFTFALRAQAQEAEPAGKKIFVDQKCNVCHSIDSQGIAKKGPAPKPTDKNPPPDLSNLGAEKSADWIAKFLIKEEMLNNKKHPKGWTGKKEDLNALSNWLATLKKT